MELHINKMTSTSFYIVLPSNTNVEGNRTNSFRVRLPRKLQFNSEWQVGLAVMVYPHSWPSLGTSEDQYVTVEWQTGESLRLPVPQSSLSNPQELRDSLHKTLGVGSEALAQKIRTVQLDYGKMVTGVRAQAKELHARIIADARPRVEREMAASAVADIQESGDVEGADRIIQQRQEAEQGAKMFTRVMEQADELLITDARPRVEKEMDASAVADIQESGDVEGADRVIEQKQGAEQSAKNVEESVPSEEEIYLRLLNEEIAKLSDESRHVLDSTKELGLEPWVQAYRHARFACRFKFDTGRNRFAIIIDNRYIKRVVLTEQLAYILGFDKMVLSESEMARFMPDMNGGVSSLQVYAPGLIEPMIVGDVCAPVLRIVTIRGKQDEIIEEQFISIQYHKLLVREVSEIFIEIRTSNGALMPFQYGTCTLTLHFKKSAYF